jgi:pyruvate dehydrogenase (quinone)
MVRKTVAEVLVDVLVDSGVERAYGLPGNSLNGITNSMSTRNDISWVGLRHEDGIAFAAGAEAPLTGGLAVCPIMRPPRKNASPARRTK